MSENCPDCGVEPEQIHANGCDVERCTVCKGQRIGCQERGSQCQGHDPWEARWRGEWPGKAECRERGWYSTPVPGKGWRPCSAETPGAVEDLNRLTYFNMTGHDDLYQGLDR